MVSFYSPAVRRTLKAKVHQKKKKNQIYTVFHFTPNVVDELWQIYVTTGYEVMEVDFT